MTLDLEAIKARAEAATPGPWQAAGMGDVATPTFVIQTTDRNPADGRFIAHARTDVPALVAEVERLRESNDLLRSALSEARTGGNSCKLTHITSYRVDL